MKRTRPALSAEELLAEHTPPIQDITERLRMLIRERIPGLTERVYPGWHALGYVHPEAGYIGGVFPRAEHVTLVFEWGVALADPEGVLTGTGTRTRNVEITDPETIPDGAITALLDAAVAYGKFRALGMEEKR